MAFQWSRVGPVAEACRSSRVSAGRRRRQRTSAEDPSFPPVSRLLRFQSRKTSCVASADASSDWSSSSLHPESRQRRRDRGVGREHAENATIQHSGGDPFAAARATERSERSLSLRRGLFELGVPPSAIPVEKRRGRSTPSLPPRNSASLPEPPREAGPEVSMTRGPRRRGGSDTPPTAGGYKLQYSTIPERGQNKIVQYTCSVARTTHASLVK